MHNGQQRVLTAFITQYPRCSVMTFTKQTQSCENPHLYLHCHLVGNSCIWLKLTGRGKNTSHLLIQALLLKRKWH